MKKALKLFVLSFMLLFILTGCSTWKSFTYDVETGDKIKVQLTTTGGYDIESKLPFSIKKDKEVIAEGRFIKGEYYDSYVDSLGNSDKIEIIKKGKKKNLEYVYYSMNDTYFYIINIKKSDTAVLLNSKDISKKDMTKVFNKLTFSVEK